MEGFFLNRVKLKLPFEEFCEENIYLYLRRCTVLS